MLIQRVKHVLWSVVVGAATLVYVIEEWLWDNLKLAMRAFGRLPGVRSVEAWIAGLPPAGAAFFFLLPSSLALPVKLVAVTLLLHGHYIEGTLVIIAAKILATALFARLYVLTFPALMRVHWFVAVRSAFLRWGAWAYRQIESHPWWRTIHARIVALSEQFKAWRSRVAGQVREAGRREP